LPPPPSRQTPFPFLHPAVTLPLRSTALSSIPVTHHLAGATACINCNVLAKLAVRTTHARRDTPTRSSFPSWRPPRPHQSPGLWTVCELHRVCCGSALHAGREAFPKPAVHSEKWLLTPVPCCLYERVHMRLAHHPPSYLPSLRPSLLPAFAPTTSFGPCLPRAPLLGLAPCSPPLRLCKQTYTVHRNAYSHTHTRDQHVTPRRPIQFTTPPPPEAFLAPRNEPTIPRPQPGLWQARRR
jgi:hypothetical protein